MTSPHCPTPPPPLNSNQLGELTPQGSPQPLLLGTLLWEDGRMREVRPAVASYSDSTMRPTRHVSDTNKLFFSYEHGRTQLRNLRHLHGHVSLCVKEWPTVQIRKTVFRTGPVLYRWPHRCGEAITSVIRYAPGTHAPDAPSTGGASAPPALRSASAGCSPVPRARTRPAPLPRGPASRRPRRPRPASRSRGCTG